jgi:hypothetical protein
MGESCKAELCSKELGKTSSQSTEQKALSSLPKVGEDYSIISRISETLIKVINK